MAEQLAGIKGRFILSLNDQPEIRELVGGFRLQQVKTNYTVAARSNSTAVRELIITNKGGGAALFTGS